MRRLRSSRSDRFVPLEPHFGIQGVFRDRLRKKEFVTTAEMQKYALGLTDALVCEARHLETLIKEKPKELAIEFGVKVRDLE